MASSQFKPCIGADPIHLASKLWPHVTFYKEQRDIIYSIWHNDETIVTAGNKLGKDYVAGFICIAFFLTRYPCRIVNTSAKDEHLRVLWGEIGQFIRTCAQPLDYKSGGPLIINHHEIKRVYRGERCPLSYIKGMVAGPDSIAAMQGHHIAATGDGVPRTMFACDESSSVNNEYYRMAISWADRLYIFGNPWACSNFFNKGVEAGDLSSRDGTRYYRKIIRVRAQDSPNVRMHISQQLGGKRPPDEILVNDPDAEDYDEKQAHWKIFSREQYDQLHQRWVDKFNGNEVLAAEVGANIPQPIIVPGVKGYDEYIKNRMTWDEEQQSVSLDGTFFKGDAVMMYPTDWLERANQIGDKLAHEIRVIKAEAKKTPVNRIAATQTTTPQAPTYRLNGCEFSSEKYLALRKRVAKGIGSDPAEGGNSTTFAAVDEYGLIELISIKTPNTAQIAYQVRDFMKKHHCNPSDVVLDRGGGGKQIADRLREMGYPVRTIGFGTAVSIEPKEFEPTSYDESIDNREEQYAFINRRNQMYDALRDLLNPSLNPDGWAIPISVDGLKAPYAELIRQLSLIPRRYDSEGRLTLPPKRRKNKLSKEECLEDILGCSPDEADAVVMAVYAMQHKEQKPKIRVA